MARSAKKQTDAAQSMLVTVWNIAIAGGGLLGGGILNHFGVGGYVPVTLALLFLCLAVIFACRKAFRS
jgi:predicted MFS family arabinose efflux permease